LSKIIKSTAFKSMSQLSMANFAVQPKRVAVTGSAGQIAYSLLFRIASGQMLGPE